MKKTEVIFLHGMTKDMEDHYSQKDYRHDVVLKIDDLYYEVYFFTQMALTYVMRDGGYCSFPGMIILDEISDKLILNAIKELIGLRYFESFAGYKELPLNNRFSHRWFIMGESTSEKMTSITVE